MRPSARSPVEQFPSAANTTIAQLNSMESQFLRSEQKSKAARPSDVVPLKNVQAKVDTHLKKTASCAPATVMLPKYSSVLNRNTNSSAVGPIARNTSRTTLSSRNVIVGGTTPGKTAVSSTSTLLANRKSDLIAKPTTARVGLVAKPPANAQFPLKTTSAPTTTSQAQQAISQSVDHQPPKRFASRSKTMIELPNNKSRASVHAITMNNQRLRRISREDIASSSSTLKASNEMIGSRSSLVGGSRTHLQRIDGGKTRGVTAVTVAADSAATTTASASIAAAAASTVGDDGWLMVKAKRRSSLHWANRFHQPTGYASLPSLALQPSGNGGGGDCSDAKSSRQSFAKKEYSNNNRKQVKSVATSATTATHIGSKSKGSAGITVAPNNNLTGSNIRKVKVQQSAAMKDVSVPTKCNANATMQPSSAGGKSPTAFKTIVAKVRNNLCSVVFVAYLNTDLFCVTSFPIYRQT